MSIFGTLRPDISARTGVRALLFLLLSTIVIVLNLKDFYAGRFDVHSEAEYINLRTREASVLRINYGIVTDLNNHRADISEELFGKFDIEIDSTIDVIRFPNGVIRIILAAPTIESKVANLTIERPDKTISSIELNGKALIEIGSGHHNDEKSSLHVNGPFYLYFNGTATIGRNEMPLNGSGEYNPSDIFSLTIRESASRHVPMVGKTDIEVSQKVYGQSYVAMLGDRNNMWSGIVSASRGEEKRGLLLIDASSRVVANVTSTFEVFSKSDQDSRITNTAKASNWYIFSDSDAVKLVVVGALIWEALKDGDRVWSKIRAIIIGLYGFIKNLIPRRQ